MLSLSPRYDLFKISLPKEFLPKDIEEKYRHMLSINSNVILTPIDYLNESIQGVSFPGMSELTMQQPQHSYNPNPREKISTHETNLSKLGRINVEPKTDITYKNSANPLDKIDKSFKIIFRLNQGFINYFMIYETLFYNICKHINKAPINNICIEILNETGLIVSKLTFTDVYLDGIQGLEFNFNKLERDSGTFEVEFKYNNINYEFLGA